MLFKDISKINNLKYVCYIYKKDNCKEEREQTATFYTACIIIKKEGRLKPAAKLFWAHTYEEGKNRRNFD